MITVEQITSIDGYAAEPDGGIEFFGAVPFPDDHRTDTEQLTWLEGVDAILLGRVTYEMFAGHWPTADPAVDAVAEPINRLPKYVISNSLTAAPWGDDTIEVLRGDGVASAGALGERHGSIVVWGSLTLTDALFDAGLVTNLRLRVVPVLIGSGRSFTPAALGQRMARLDAVHQQTSGHVNLSYTLG